MSGPVKYSMDSTSNNETLTNHRDFHWDPLPQIFQSFFFFLEEGRWRRGRGCKTKMLLSLINSDIPEDTTPGDKTWQHPQINLSIFQSISIIQLLLSSVLPCGCKERSFHATYQTWNIKHSRQQGESGKAMHSKVFLENFEIFGNVMRHCPQCWIYPLKSK